MVRYVDLGGACVVITGGSSGIGADLPVGRAGTADDVAHAVTFLMSNGFTTGAVLDVHGGQQ